jgi:anti-anti-sigma regulatory factor
MSEGQRRFKSATETFWIADGVACLVIRGTLTHILAAPILEWLERTAREGVARGLIIDCSEVESVEPGVGGRIIAHCNSNDIRIEHTVIVTRSAAIRALSGAAMVVMKDRLIDCVSTRAEALAKVSGRAARGGRARQHSGEQPRPGALVPGAQVDQADRGKRSAG